MTAAISPRRDPVALGVEAVCFDCWGTLLIEIDREAVHARRVEQVVVTASKYEMVVSIDAARLALDRAWHIHWENWEAGRPSDAIDIARDALATLRVEAPGADTALVSGLAETVGEQQVRPLPGARETLRGLQRAGLRLALVCDTGFTTGAGVRRLLEAHGLLEYLEFQAFSDEAGVSKPHPRIFRTALSALDSRPEQALHVGDLRRTDVAGARALGMTTVRIRGAHDDTSEHPEADAVVDSHDELGALFGFAPGGNR